MPSTSPSARSAVSGSRVPGAAGREHGIDQIRGVAVLLVVIAHVRSIPIGVGVDVNSELLVMFTKEFHTFRMPVLLVLSGLLLSRSLHKPLSTYYRGKAEKILWPFLVWAAITAFAQAAPERLLVTPGRYLLGGPWHLWFLWVLLACYLVGPVVRWVPAWLLVPAMLAGALALGKDGPEWLLDPLFWGAFFFLGAALGSRLDSVRRLPWPVVVAAAVWALAAVTLHSTSAEFLYISPARPIVAFLGPLGAVVVVLWASGRLPRFPLFEFVGRRSMVMYVAHVPVIMVISLVLGDWAVGHRWLFYALTGLAAVCVPLLLAVAYRPLRWLFEAPTSGLGSRRAP